MQSVLVLGGSGFVGRAVCRELLKAGCAQVSSINRAGAPAAAQDLQSTVNWIKSDATKKDAYRSLSQIDTLVHCIGILTEKPDTSFHSASFETLKTALNSLPNLKRVAYVSAADFGLPSRLFLSPKYMEAKRAAEESLLQNENLSVVIARPGFMFGPDRSWTGPFAQVYSIATLFTAGFFPPALSVSTVARSLVKNVSELQAGEKRILEVKDLMQ